MIAETSMNVAYVRRCFVLLLCTTFIWKFGIFHGIYHLALTAFVSHLVASIIGAFMDTEHLDVEESLFIVWAMIRVCGISQISLQTDIITPYFASDYVF